MDYSNKTREELIAICKDKGIKGYSGKKKDEIVKMVLEKTEAPHGEAEEVFRQDVIHGDSLNILPTFESNSAQIIIADPPYNIGKDWSHESIIVLWKDDKVFHRDDIREAYTEGFINGAAGKVRAATKGRFSKGDKTTTYAAHPNGALPRDVIKIPALAGGAGMNERVNHPTQKPIALCEKLLRSCKQPNTEGYVLVPFAGSGSECVAAKNLGMSFVGIELNIEYINLINDRLNPKTE